MESIVFASNNAHKLEEVRFKLKDIFRVKSLKEIGCFDDIPETADTFEGNAELKAIWVKEKYNMDCFGDDSGLEIEALDNRPGIYSARYAGADCSYADNNTLVMKQLAGIENRKARFVTVICLMLHGEVNFFRGEVQGEIITEYRGKEGFGYDPIFKPLGYDKTFAEMGLEEKNKLSHRAIALNKMLHFLKENY